MTGHGWRSQASRLLVGLVVVLGWERGLAAGAEDIPLPLLTVAERSGYRATARSDEVVTLIDRLVQTSPNVRRVDFGTTVEGRPLVAAVVAHPPLSTPAELAAADPRLVVLLLGGIHAGECDGKEALLMLLRDLALRPDHPWLRDLVILAVPNYNADGSERVGKLHRPGQLGPDEGTGRRENAQQLDLNRDGVKLEALETRALIGLVNAWNPQVVIDTHTTNGSRHRYALTYDLPHNPASPATIREFLRREMLPEVTRRLDAKGIGTFFYGNFDSAYSRWTTFGHEPRHLTEYVGLRGRLAILSESYSYISYEQRIQATKAFVSHCLEYLGERRDDVRRLVAEAAAATTAAGAQPRPEDQVAIRAQVAAFPDKVTVRGYDAASEPQAPPANAAPKDYLVEYFGRYEPTTSVPRPFAYVLPFHESRVADRLRMHGIVLEQLTQDVTLPAEIYRIDGWNAAGNTYQGHRAVTSKATRRAESRAIPAGSYVIRTGQPLGTLATYLLEPESDDGLVTWNFFDHSVVAGQDFPVIRLPAAAALATRAVDRIEPAQRLDLDQIYGPQRSVPFGGAVGFSLQWLPKSTRFAQRMGDGQMLVDAASGAVEPYRLTQELTAQLEKLPEIGRNEAQRIAGSPVAWSADRQVACFAFASDLFVCRLGGDRALRVTNSPEAETEVSLSPDGQMLAFVRDYNLYLVPTEGGAERALTRDGSADRLNGRMDWVYEEELYGRGVRQAYWWSPDSRQVALLQFDETPVFNFTVSDHLPYRQDLEVTRYPKAGDPLPKVRLGVVPAAGGSVRWIEDFEYSADDLLISRVDWSADGRQLVYQVQNRAQTWLDLRLVAADGGASRRLLRETGPAWVSVLGAPRWLKDGSFLWLSERSGHQHLYRISADGQNVTPVTSGEWDVETLHGVDANEQWVYFTACKDSGIAAHAYRVHLDGSELTQLTSGRGNHAPRFCDSHEYFFDFSSDIDRPPQIRLFRGDGQYVRTIDPNLADYLPYYKLQKPEFLQVPARDGLLLDAMLIKPADFDPQKKYPVLCHVYAGPQAPVVKDRWSGSTYLWHQLLAQQGYVIWMCDNRLATHRGAKLAWTSHRRLGEKELEDIEDGLGWLKQQPWIDSGRIGIWGWSYGGYMTSYALTHSQSFKAGISGAPVTDWRNYDAVYTERYMGLPQDNPEGYQKSSVVTAADRLHGRLLLIHGTIDDNVHLANTLQLVHALQQAGKHFDLMLYPRNRHGVTNPKQSRHMREMMTKFLLENL